MKNKEEVTEISPEVFFDLLATSFHNQIILKYYQNWGSEYLISDDLPRYIETLGILYKRILNYKKPLEFYGNRLLLDKPDSQTFVIELNENQMQVVKNWSIR